LLHIISLHLKC